jgi:glycerate 2-kinase
VHNMILGNNEHALAAAAECAWSFGFRVENLGAHFQGETQELARTMADAVSRTPPGTCLLSGGETTVTLGTSHGKGGRNQEFVLACLLALGPDSPAIVLSGGTDGEDGPTDAAGAVADAATLQRATLLGLDPHDYLQRHDAYHFFAATDGLLLTGLTQTNVMDVRVILVP